MCNRRYMSAKDRERLILVLFLGMVFLSAMRIIDLLPAATPAAAPAMTRSPGDGESVPAPEDLAAGPKDKGPEDLGDLEGAAPSTADRLLAAEVERWGSGLDLRGPGPRVLIYHTHTTEAYRATASSPYVQTSSYRTADATKSVLAVGEALAERLRTAYGFAVIHDTTNHEPPRLKTAYERSEQTMRAYLEQYPTLELFIDIHRDASSDTSDYVLVDGRPTARLMCVVGQGTKYAEKPDFDSNFSLASKLTEHLRLTEGRLARDVRVKPGRYNQHVGKHCLLIEVGHNANTLEQALNAVPVLAESLALSLAETTEPMPSRQAADRLSLVPAGIDKYCGKR